MQDIDKLSREELVQHLKFAAGLAIGVDGLWFLAAEEATGFDRALEMDVKVWTNYASLLVKRIRKYFGITGGGLDALKEVMRHDPLWWSIDVKITEDTPERLVFEVWNCPSLNAMEKMGREQLTCEPVEKAYLEAMSGAVDPEIKVEALKLPPRSSPDEVCCRWLFHK